jgi:hypothetical protein
MSVRCYIFGHRKGSSGKMTWDYKCPDCGNYWDKGQQSMDTFWDSDAWMYTKIVLATIFWAMVGMGIIAIVFTIVDSRICAAYSSKGIPTEWSFWTGCLANHPKFGWIPVDEYFKTFNIYNP